MSFLLLLLLFLLLPAAILPTQIPIPAKDEFDSFKNFLTTERNFPLIIFYDLSNDTPDYLNNLIHYSSYYSPYYVYVQKVKQKIITNSRLEIILFDTKNTLRYFLRKSLLNNGKYTKYLFICNRPLPLIDTMNLVWTAGIWNFIFFLTEYKLFYYYNPFTSKFVSSKLNIIFDQFEKFNDINQYEIQVSIARQSPNFNLQIIEKLGHFMNAKLAITRARDMDDNYRLVKEKKVEMSFSGDFYGLYNDVKYMEPIKRNDIMILAPKDVAFVNYLQFLHLLDIWVYIFLLEVLFILVLWLLERKDYSEIAVIMLGISLGTVVNLKPSKCHLPSKLLIISWMCFSVIMMAVYSSTLVGNLVKLHNAVTDEMNSIDQLKESNRSVCLPKEFVEFIPNDLRFQIKTRESVMEDILKRTNCCYALMRNQAEIFASAMPEFYVIKESLIPAYESMYFKKSSAFIYKINDIMKRVEAAGLFVFVDVPEDRPSSHHNYITINELGSILVVLSMGFALSILVFALETALGKYFGQ